MKRLTCLFITLLSLSSLLLISGCTNETNFKKNEPHIVGKIAPGPDLSLTGNAATKEMIKVLKKDLKDHQASYELKMYDRDTLRKTTRREMIKLLKKYLQTDQSDRKPSGSSDTIQSDAYSCTCLSAISFLGNPPPGSRTIYLHTQTECPFITNISHSQDYHLYVADEGYPLGSGHFYDPGGWTAKLYTKNSIPIYGNPVTVTLESTHEFPLYFNRYSYATRTG